MQCYFTLNSLFSFSFLLSVIFLFFFGFVRLTKLAVRQFQVYVDAANFI